MNTYAEIEELYEKIKNTDHPLTKEVTAFHNFAENYENGKGDVIFGLHWMDEKVKEINTKFIELTPLKPDEIK